jgi:hypothetical protein
MFIPLYSCTIEFDEFWLTFLPTTLITFKMQHVWQIILLNGFEGGFSAIAYVGAIFCSFGHIGSMAGGWIQAALLKNLDGKAGIPAWRWIFIVVGVLTIPSAIFGEFIRFFAQIRVCEEFVGSIMLIWTQASSSSRTCQINRTLGI